MKGFIYKIINTKTPEIYIGSTIQTLKNRIKEHKRNAKLGKTDRLHEHMRIYGAEFFSIELVEEMEFDSKTDLQIREKEYYEVLKPSLNMSPPSISVDKRYGRVYRIYFVNDRTKNFIGSTTQGLSDRLKKCRSFSDSGKSPLYKLMRENGKENFEIELLEDGVPVDQLTERENYWKNKNDEQEISLQSKKDPTKGIIYKITNTETPDIYIGSTIQPLKNRFKTHKSNAKLGKTEKLYEYMRIYGVECFSIELLEEFEIISKSDLGIKENEYYRKFNPSLNMKSPNICTDREYGRVYSVYLINDKTKNYIGSTIKNINDRLSDHRSASNNGKTPFYNFMRQNGKENFEIECLEDDVPFCELITRENYWINELDPPLNKNTNLCITEKERDRLKYIRNREKRLKQVSERRLLKRDEINEQKRQHYLVNKDKIGQKDKDKRKELREKEVTPYEQNPLLTQETLESHTVFELKEIAKRFGLDKTPKLKPKLIEKILNEQKAKFTA
jgi:predicted GIY-YIG superfamily endonuclease